MKIEEEGSRAYLQLMSRASVSINHSSDEKPLFSENVV